MVLHSGTNVTIVFPGWVTDYTGKFVVSCIGLFFMAVLFEAIKYFREKLIIKNKASRKNSFKEQNFSNEMTNNESDTEIKMTYYQ